jgi:hypothetical protein
VINSAREYNIGRAYRGKDQNETHSQVNIHDHPSAPLSNIVDQTTRYVRNKHNGTKRTQQTEGFV